MSSRKEEAVPQGDVPMVDRTSPRADQDDERRDSSDPNEQVSRKRKPEKEKERLGDTAWFMITNPEAGRPYFMNSDTNQTVWTLPDELQEEFGELVEKKNKDCSQLQEDKPGEIEARMPKAKKKQNSASVRSEPPSVAVKSTENGPPPSVPSSVSNPSPSAARIRSKGKSSVQIGDSHWWMIDDPQAEKPYFYNAKINKTVWALPPEVASQYGASLDGSATGARTPGPSVAAPQPTLSTALLNVVSKGKEKQSSMPPSSVPARSSKDARLQQMLSTTQNKRIGNTDWLMVTDPARNNRPYYYNTKTEKTQWNHPSLSGTNSDAAPPSSGSRQLNGSSRLHKKSSTQIGNSEWWIIHDEGSDRPYYYNTTTQKTEWTLPANVPKKTSKQLGDSEWWEIQDPSTSKAYYFNSSTQKTQWEHPSKVRQTGAELKSSAAKADRVSFNSRTPISSLKCRPTCEAKLRAQHTYEQLRQTTDHKKSWQRKYAEAQDHLALMDQRVIPAFESSSPPSNDNLTTSIPQKIQDVKKSVIDAIQTADRATMLSALSTSDLRQLLLLKTSVANFPSLQTIFTYLHQPPSSQQISSQNIHPSHRSSFSTDHKNPFDFTRAYPCFQCGQRYLSSSALEQHLRQHSSNELKCDEENCSLLFPSELLLNLHRTAHSQESSSSQSPQDESKVCSPDEEMTIAPDSPQPNADYVPNATDVHSPDKSPSHSTADNESNSAANSIPKSPNSEDSTHDDDDDDREDDPMVE